MIQRSIFGRVRIFLIFRSTWLTAALSRLFRERSTLKPSRGFFSRQRVAIDVLVTQPRLLTRSSQCVCS